MSLALLTSESQMVGSKRYSYIGCKTQIEQSSLSELQPPSLESLTFQLQHHERITSAPPKPIESSTAIRTLDDAHQAAFERATANVFATDIAELTFFQLVDGLPLWQVACDQSKHWSYRDAETNNHGEQCRGAMEKYQALRDAFDLLGMDIRAEVS